MPAGEKGMLIHKRKTTLVSNKYTYILKSCSNKDFCTIHWLILPHNKSNSVVKLTGNWFEWIQIIIIIFLKKGAHPPRMPS